MLPPQAPSYWIRTAAPAAYDPLPGDARTDICIVGGGIVGLTLAWVAQQRGRRVLLLEARRIAQQVTGFTTAKITSLHGRRYAALARSHGRDAARLYGASNEAALAWIVRTAGELGLDANLRLADAYTYTEQPEHVTRLREEAETAAQLGLPASFVTTAPLPFPIQGAVRFTGQAQYHPLRFLAGLAERFVAAGGTIHEGTRALDVDEDAAECRVEHASGVVTAEHVVVCTHLPFINRGGHFAMTYPHSHVAAAAPHPGDATALASGMYINDETPSRSVRVEHDGQLAWLVASGGGFKTGQGDAAAEMDGLVAWLRERFGVHDVPYRWVNEDFHSDDGLPYVGRIAGDAKRVWTATGFNAWGMTGGTMAALLLDELLDGRAPAWASLYDATRIDPLRSAKEFVVQNANVAKEFVRGHVARGEARAPADLAPGEAAILAGDGGKVAAYRDPDGALHCVDAACTHMGCAVAWNGVARTWDCPCHGSRFTVDGEVLYGPATKALAPR